MGEMRTLLVVYKNKDEMALNQLKKMIDTDDDTSEESFVGTEDGTVEVIAWNEKTWLDNKKAGNTGDVTNKILFLGDIKGTDKLSPVIDVKYSKYGISYGFAGDQALLTINEKALSKRADYEDFLKDLKSFFDSKIANDDKKIKMKDAKTWLRVGASLLMPWVAGVAFAGLLIKDAFGDAALVRNQMLLYGVTKLYLNDLDSFMKA